MAASTTQRDTRPEAPALLARTLGGAGGRVLIVLAILAYAVVLVRTAWICDDAYITFRTVSNFVCGYGLTWNVGERVQAYTHPLWMFLLSGLFGLSGNIYYSAMFLSIGLSLAAVLVYALGIARTVPQAILGVTVLLSSKAFVDYSTSGLENPLSYLLVAWFLLYYLREEEMSPRRLLALSLLASLLVLNRMDLILMVGSALLYAFWQGRGRKGVGMVVLGFVPFLAWELFSVIYYGFPFPNTAYAKLNTGIPAGELLPQGLHYFANSLRQDPVTLPAIGCAVVAAAISRRGRHLALAIGIALYLLYVAKIGGDFMSGRFFAVPLLAAVAILGMLEFERRRLVATAVAMVPALLLLSLCGPRPCVLSGSRCGIDQAGVRDSRGISDERAAYYQATGLLRGDPSPDIPGNGVPQRAAQLVAAGPRVRVCTDSIGVLGYYAGPSVHLVDVLALPDPLLARLPVPAGEPWRIGHFRRFVPDGYLESLLSGRSELTDLPLRQFYEKLRLVTTGPIFSWLRFRAILDLNLGRCSDLIDTEYYRHPPLRLHTGPHTSDEARDTAALDVRLPPAGAWIDFGESCHASRVEITFDRARACRVLYPQGPAEPVEQSVPAEPAGAAVHTVQVPDAVRRTGFDRLLIRPAPGDDACYVRRIRLFDSHPQPEQ